MMMMMIDHKPYLILQITLKLEPMFKRSITYLAKSDSDLGDEVVTFGRQHEFGDITWYPSQQKAVYRVDDRVPINTSGNGLYDFIPFRPTPSLELALIRSTGLLSIYLYHILKYSKICNLSEKVLHLFFLLLGMQRMFKSPQMMQKGSACLQKPQQKPFSTLLMDSLTMVHT